MWKSLKERYRNRLKQDVICQANNLITVQYFNNELYIAFNGTPIILVEEGWTSKEIIQELLKLRQNYINSRYSDLKIE